MSDYEALWEDKCREVEKLEADRDRWKRMYERACVKDEGMKLYVEIERLKAEVAALSRIVKRGAWPK